MEKARLYTPDVLVSENTVIVTTNHLGASMETPDGGSQGDSGIDAQMLANISGQLVIGLDRPHTGNGQHYSAVQSSIARVEPKIVVKHWVNKLKPALQEIGARDVELIGRSIGANFLMEVAVLELLPVSGIVAVDPLAVRKSKLSVATLRHGRQSLTTSPSALRRQILDMRQNRHYLTSDQSNITAALVAAKLRSVKALFAFVDHQKPNDRNGIADTIDSLNGLRSRKNGIAPLHAEFVDGSTHTSIGMPQTYGKLYERYRALGRTGDVFTQKIETVKTDLV